jgi:transposase InsO family protein
MNHSPVVLQELLRVHLAAGAAPSGGKAEIYAAACKNLCVSLPTLHRYLKETMIREPRKQRSDAGQLNLSLQQAQMLSAVLMEGYRANDKKISSVAVALKRLRKNYPRFAEWCNTVTGEQKLLSTSACARALRHYKLHPDQLRVQTSAQAQRSLHPNDVWQIDASISTLFYVPEGGVSDMSPAVFYKNQPGNFEKIKRQRLTRNVITDHTSGAIFVHYVAGGESIANMADSFLKAIEPRNGQMMHGVPFHLCMDPGSGFAGAFKNLLTRLQCTPVVNQAGNPRAKGQVENAHNLVECDFESGFKYTDVPSLEWINAQAQDWMRYYNSTRIHSRHGLTRYAKWMEITQEQLRLVNPDIARALLLENYKTPKVVDLQVRFAGKYWSVKDIANVVNGETLRVTYNPFNAASAYVISTDVDGHEQLIEIPEVAKGEHGFEAEAALIGREYKSQPDTLADTNRKLVERLATGTASDEEAARARKAKVVPFGGLLQPYAHHADVPDVTMMPRRGTELDTGMKTPVAKPVVYSGFDLATWLVDNGVAMTPERNALVAELYPNGVPEEALLSVKARLTVRAGLRIVGGDV